jgi:eukaryotic-like serine/threonine-protein kinase
VEAERWQQVERLYYAALERVEDVRTAFLSDACAGDEGLRREVESLLAFEDQSADFIESPALEIAAKMMAEEQTAVVALGQTIKHYKITSALGPGGMGEVYLADDTRLGRRVALKLLPARFTQDGGRLRRFELEARAVAALSHPNACAIHELVETGDGRQCIVMEYVEGVTLRERIVEGRMNVGEALDAAVQIASALGAAHEAGIIHRDVKPENIVLRRDRIVKVLDFGLAKLTERQAVVASEQRPMAQVTTEAGVVLGTVSYMSPEQARGLSVDARTDIWSLGCVLYEMIAGRAPFEGETTSDLLASILKTELPPLNRFAPEVPSEFERIVERSLRKERDDRYQTIEELLIDLRALKRRLAFETELKRAARSESGSGVADSGNGRARLSETAGDSALQTVEISDVLKTSVIEYVGSRTKSRRIVPLISLVIIASAVGAVIMYRSRAGTELNQRGPIHSIAVLPLENLSGDPAQEYFADGMTDALNGELAKLGALRVISRTSAMHYKGARKPLPEIARELGVDAVVEGSVVRSGDRVRIRAQLIYAATDDHIWAEAYERDLRDILSLQSEVARTIAREIRIITTPSEQSRLAGARPIEGIALDHYLRGLYHLNRRTEENLLRAVKYFEKAIEEDPDYAPAYVGLAECYFNLGTVNIGSMPPNEARRLGGAAARKALEIDSELADTHASLGKVLHYNWEWSAAEQEFKRAIELNPSHAFAHHSYAYLLSSLGRAEEALAEIKRAEELDPLSSPSVYRGYVLYMARRFDEAFDHYQKVIEADPDNYFAHWHLGFVYAAKSKYKEAIASFEKAAELSERSPASLGGLGMVYALAGRRAEAQKVLNELIELADQRYVPPVAIVHIHTGLGNKDQAFAWLEKAYQERSNFLAYLKVAAMVDPLRSDPRFTDLVRRVGLG